MIVRADNIGRTIRHCILAAALLPAGLAGQTANSITIHDAGDGQFQGSRPITLGRAFVKGEIPNLPQASIHGELVTTQADVKARWPDGSIQFAVLSFWVSVPPRGSVKVDFINGANEPNTEFLRKEQMLAFNESSEGSGDGWDAAIEVVAGDNQLHPVQARDMLVRLAFQPDQIRYWLQGPVATQVIIEDRSPELSADFGWHWTGGRMNPSRDARHQSLHPMFVVTFYPNWKGVQIEYIVENCWTNRIQDQFYSLQLKTRGGTMVLAKDAFLHYAKTRWRKVFFDGQALPPVRIDHNTPYLISTGVLPNYDLRIEVDTRNELTGNPSSEFPGGFARGDKGDVLGSANVIKAFSGNEEGGIYQRQDALLAYTWDANMYEVVFGTSVAGGGGVSAVPAHVPLHWREGRQDGKVFCGSSCTDAHKGATAFGRVFSTDAWPAQQTLSYHATAAVGDLSSRHNWAPDVAHLVDYSFLPYLLTGEWYRMEETLFWAAWASNALNPGTFFYQSHGPWAFMTPNSGAAARAHAWGLRSLAHAAWAAPEGSAEKELFTSKVHNNIEIMEGYYDFRTGAFPPANVDCPGYHRDRTTDKWCWGKFTVGGAQDAGPSDRIHLDNPLLFPGTGLNSPERYFADRDVTWAMEAPWMFNFMFAAWAHLEELGFEKIGPLRAYAGRFFVNRILHPDFNFYLADLYSMPTRREAGAGQRNPFFQTWAEVKRAVARTYDKLRGPYIQYTPPAGYTGPCILTVSENTDYSTPASTVSDGQTGSRARSYTTYKDLEPGKFYYLKVDCNGVRVHVNTLTATGIRDKTTWGPGSSVYSAENGYAFSTLGALSFYTDVEDGGLSGLTAYNRMLSALREFYPSTLVRNPKWAIVPRPR